jgi:hypothetical protein
MSIRDQIVQILSQCSERLTNSELDSYTNRIINILSIDDYYLDSPLDTLAVNVVEMIVKDIEESKKSENLGLEIIREDEDKVHDSSGSGIDINIVKILRREGNRSHDGIPQHNIVQILGDALNLVTYNNVQSSSSCRQDTNNGKEYKSNYDFWKDALNGNLVEGIEINLIGFHLMQWLPSSPGRYYTQSAIRERQNAESHLRRRARYGYWEFLPQGKEAMFLGGIGSVRLGARRFDSETIYLLGASSSGCSHQGIPVMVPNREYQKVISHLREGGCVANIEGYLRVYSTNEMLIQYDRQIPKYVIFIEDIKIIRPSQSLLVSVGVTFALQDSDRGNVKSWSFCSFDPVNDDVSSAAKWLEEYAMRYSGRAEILSDFDEYYQHFGNDAVEFPVSQIVKGNVDSSRIRKYQEDLGFEVNLNIQRLIMGDNYSAGQGQVGAMGPNSQATGNTFQQCQSNIDLPSLAHELETLRIVMRKEAIIPEHDIAIGEVAAAQTAAAQGNGAKALEHLKSAGQWALDVSTKIGIGVAIAAIKTALGT